MTALKDYYDIIEKLNASEINKLEVIKWLVSDDMGVRGTGRTKIMAIAFVRLALEGKHPKIFDHFQGKDSKRFITDAIYRIFKSSDGIRINGDIVESEEAVLADGAIVVPGIRKEEVLQSLLLDFRTLCGLLMGSGVSAKKLHDIINILEVESIMRS